MNKFNILWIDDDWSNDEEDIQYQMLDNIASKITIKNPEINIIVRSSIAEAHLLLSRSNKYDFVIIDLDYKNENEKHESEKNSFIDIINIIIDKNIKFCIFTSQKESFNSQLKKVYKLAEHLLLNIYVKDNEAKFIKDIIKFSKILPLNVVHLSDFHFDSSLSGARKDEQEQRLNKLIDVLEEENEKNAIDFIIFSGDFANHNPKEDLVECAKILREIVIRTTNNFDRLLIVPGNHDIEWDNYSEAKLSKKPCESYYNFINTVYDKSNTIISNLVGYNEKNNSFDNHYRPDSFSWSRNFNKNTVRIIGLNSAIAEPDQNLKGKGEISKDSIKFLEKEWRHKASVSELRIAIFHHNVLPPFSINPLEENESLLNSGLIIDKLASLDCDILLSGHCHDTYIYNFKYNILGYKGFSKTRNLTYISAGTSGGYAPGGDRARSFNFIRLYPTTNNQIKTIYLTPYVYDSMSIQWIKQKTLSKSIKKYKK